MSMSDEELVPQLGGGIGYRTDPAPKRMQTGCTVVAHRVIGQGEHVKGIPTQVAQAVIFIADGAGIDEECCRAQGVIDYYKEKV